MNNIMRFLLLSALVILLVGITGCGKKEVNPEPKVYFGNALQLKPFNLPSLLNPSKLCYELWLVKFDFTVDDDSNAIRVVEDELSLGKFYWNRDAYEFFDLESNPMSDVFPTPGERNIYDFNVIMITVEPLADDGVRSNNGLIFYEITDPILPIHGQFDFFNRAAYDVVLEYDPPSGYSKNEISAGYVLKTYSDDGDPDSDPYSGLWFHGIKRGGTHFVMSQTLHMPLIKKNANFVYEGWVMTDSFPRPLSTGKFRNPNVQDWDNSHGGTYWYPNVPGEDFLSNLPPGFPSTIDLVGEGTVYITIEPYPDPEPDQMFPFVLFEGSLPEEPGNFDHIDFDMGNRYDRLPSFDAVVLTR